MKYRGLTYNREKESYEWVYGLPSYGYATDEVAEIGTVYGDFKEIFPDTLGEQTPYEFKAHDSLEDVKATLYCYKKMEEDIERRKGKC